MLPFAGSPSSKKRELAYVIVALALTKYSESDGNDWITRVPVTHIPHKVGENINCGIRITLIGD